MIRSIGVDTVEIERFAQWHTYSDAQLLRIFSQEEIDYCRANIIKSAERFAVRYAAREAFFKALQQIVGNQKIPFLRLCKAIEIQKKLNGQPLLLVNWKLIDCEFSNKTNTFISLTHSRTIATAFIILEQKENASENFLTRSEY